MAYRCVSREFFILGPSMLSQECSAGNPRVSTTRNNGMELQGSFQLHDQHSRARNTIQVNQDAEYDTQIGNYHRYHL